VLKTFAIKRIFETVMIQRKDVNFIAGLSQDPDIVSMLVNQ